MRGSGGLRLIRHAHNLSGATFRFEYLRRAFDFRQIDVEFAAAQLLYLCVSPKKVYRFVDYKKQTKNTRARDDPAFVLILTALMFLAGFAYGITFCSSLQRVLLSAMLPPSLFLISGGLVASISYLVVMHMAGRELSISNVFFNSNSNNNKSNSRGAFHQPYQAPTPGRHLSEIDLQESSRTFDLEWAYCFDIHSNGSFILFLFCTVAQFFLLPLTEYLVPRFLACLINNLLYCLAVTLYFYVTSLGYSKLPYVSDAQLFMYPISVAIGVFLILTICRINPTDIYVSVLCW